MLEKIALIVDFAPFAVIFLIVACYNTHAIPRAMAKRISRREDSWDKDTVEEDRLGVLLFLGVLSVGQSFIGRLHSKIILFFRAYPIMNKSIYFFLIFRRHPDASSRLFTSSNSAVSQCDFILIIRLSFRVAALQSGYILTPRFI